MGLVKNTDFTYQLGSITMSPSFKLAHSTPMSYELNIPPIDWSNINPTNWSIGSAVNWHSTIPTVFNNTIFNWNPPAFLADNINTNHQTINLPSFDILAFDTNISPTNIGFDTFNRTTSTPRTTTRTSTHRSKNPSSLQLSLVDNAKYYVGKVNSDSEGNRLFSNGVQQAWCADFVTHVARDTFGTALPSDFGSSAVSGLRSWAQNNDCYTEVPSSNKADFIRKNVKPGDIMIEKKNGKSHTGIVTKVNDDGSFETVEGNCSNSVTTRTYAANSSTLSGFISLEQYA